MSAAQDADVINSATSDPVPSMQPPLTNQVELLRGIRELGEGIDKWHSKATVREMTGADEEFIAAFTAQNPDLTVTEYMTKLLERTVMTVGDIEVNGATGILDKLILADRDTLFLGVVRSTYGTTRDIRVVCSKCGSMNDVVIDLDEDFKFDKPDHSLQEPRKVTASKTDFYLRAPNAEDLTDAQKTSKTDAEFNTILLSRCASFPVDEPADRLEWARGLNVGVRKKLIQELLKEADYGPNLEGVETQCASCGTSMPIMLDWVSLLLG